MNPNLEKILEYLDKVGAKVGMIGEKLFHHLVKLEFADSATSLIIAAIFCLTMMIIGRILWLHSRKVVQTGPNEDGTPFKVGGLVVSAIGLIVILICASCCVPSLICPEGVVIKNMMR